MLSDILVSSLRSCGLAARKDRLAADELPSAGSPYCHLLASLIVDGQLIYQEHAHSATAVAANHVLQLLRTA